MEYIVYTDGACSVNKRLGGYAAIARFNGQQIVVHGNKKNATNNEMELLAVLAILHVLERFIEKNDTVTIYSDSAYVVNTVNEKWLGKWIRNNWRTADDKPVKNVELWLDLQGYLAEFARSNAVLKFVKVKGHSDCKLNNYVDRLAVKETERLKNKQLED